MQRLLLANKALALKQFWALCKESETLWLKWMHTYYLKGRKIWELVPKASYSWSFNSILRMRNEAELCLDFQTGEWK